MSSISRWIWTRTPQNTSDCNGSAKSTKYYIRCKFFRFHIMTKFIMFFWHLCILCFFSNRILPNHRLLIKWQAFHVCLLMEIHYHVLNGIWMISTLHNMYVLQYISLLSIFLFKCFFSFFPHINVIIYYHYQKNRQKKLQKIVQSNQHYVMYSRKKIKVAVYNVYHSIKPVNRLCRKF